MAQRRTVRDIPGTPHFNFLYGCYHLSEWRIPYFSTAMSLKDAASSLKLASDFPGSELIQWRLDELYQRDIDWPRVERKIVPYLHARDQPQFFNALSIALIPFREGEQLPLNFSGYDDWEPPELKDAERFEKVYQVGPIICGFWEDWKSLNEVEARTGQLRWNPYQAFAVALDGQHRLAAIQRYAHSPGVPGQYLEETQIPVILLVLDEELGYKAPVGRGLVDVLRTLFIDLNKHARKVSRAREILLDDKDPTSVCVRALVGEKIADGTAELAGSTPRLPLSLVDWHTEQAKFDEGPYIATILGLDWIVSSALGTKPISDYTDYAAIRRQLRALRISLGLELKSAEERLADLAGIQMRPFYYSDEPENDELAAISKAFRRVWTGAVVRILTELRPYKELIARREREQSFSLDFVNWYRLRYGMKKDRFFGRATEEYKKLLGRLSARTKNPIGENALEQILARIEGLKADSLAFNVVFQRALFMAFDEFQKIRGTHFEELEAGHAEEENLPDFDAEASEEDESDGGDQGPQTASDGIAERAGHIEDRSRQFVCYMNSLIDSTSKILDVESVFEVGEGKEERFWLGTLLKPDGGIDFTQGAAKRASDVLFWSVSMQAYAEVVEPARESDFDEFWTDTIEGKNALTRRIARSVRRFSEKESSAGGRILRANEEEFSGDASREEARKRMEWIWRMLGL